MIDERTLCPTCSTPLPLAVPGRSVVTCPGCGWRGEAAPPEEEPDARRAAFAAAIERSGVGADAAARTKPRLEPIYDEMFVEGARAIDALAEDDGAQPVDGAGLLPRAHAAMVASHVPPAVAADIVSEIRNALVPALSWLDRGRADRARESVKRMLELADALVKRAREGER